MSDKSNIRIFAVVDASSEQYSTSQGVVGYMISDGKSEIRLTTEDAVKVIEALALRKGNENKLKTTSLEPNTLSQLDLNNSRLAPTRVPDGFVEVDRFKSEKNWQGQKVFYVVLRQPERGEFAWYDERDGRKGLFARLGSINDRNSQIGKFLLALDELSTRYPIFSAYDVSKEFPSLGRTATIVKLKLLLHEEYLRLVPHKGRGNKYEFTSKGFNKIRELRGTAINMIRE